MVSPIDYTVRTNPLAALEGFGSGLNMSQQRQNMALADSQEARAAEAFAVDQERGATQWDWAQQDRGMMLEDRQRALAAQEEERQAALQWQADAQGLLAKAEAGTLSAMDFAEMRLKYPEQSDGLKEVFDGMSQDRRRNEALDISRGLTALKTGNVTVALDLLDERIEQAENADDRMGADQYRTLKSLIEMDPAAGQVQLGLMLTEADPDMAKVVLGNGDSRKMSGQPRALKDGGSITYFEDGTALVRDAAGNELTGQAAIDAAKEVPKDNDPAKIREIKEKLRVLGIDETSKEGQEAFRTNGKSLEGMDSPEVQKLRKEWVGLPAVKTFQEQSAANGRIEAAAKDATGASDVALVFNYMKMLDPGSVVREGEFATAENTGGVADKIVGTYNKLLSGERLTPDIRDNFLKMSRALYKDAETQYTGLEKQYRETAKRQGIPESAIVDFRYVTGAGDSGSAPSVTDDIDALLLEADGL